jgi:ribosomal protein S12 methylthiotransferase
VREILLIGQDTTSYGEDLGLREGLPLLLEHLAKIESLSWVRFLYAYPNRITPRLLETVAAHERLANYLDLPLQHASRPVLARMKRGASGDAFLKLVERIRSTIRGVAIRTSFIVGFPGETEADFRELLGFVRAAEFDWVGVFAYSDDERSESYSLDSKVDAETIARRRSELLALQRKISARRLARQVGQRVRVILDGPSTESELLWEARTEQMAPEIDGKLFVTELAEGVPAEGLLPGTIAEVEITQAHDYDLVGRIVALEASPALPPPEAVPGVWRRKTLATHGAAAPVNPLRILS